jgi:hypothetical protein
MLCNFNPTIYKDNNVYRQLIRCETDTRHWSRSIFSYKYNILSLDYKILESHDMSFIIKKKRFKNVLRSKLYYKGYKWCMEDITILSTDLGLNYKVIGTCNICCQRKPIIFRVGIVEIDFDLHTIKLLKTLKVKNMNRIEKNWNILEHNSNYYCIYSYFPFKVYKINKDLTLSKYITIDSKNLLRKIDTTCLYSTYKSIYFTGSGHPIKMDKDNYLIILKRRVQNGIYEYYVANIYMGQNSIKLTIKNKISLMGNKLYLNSVHLIDNKIIGCIGKEDKGYDTIELDLTPV